MKNRQIQEKDRQEHKSVFVQAYELFLRGEKPIDVAIALNIGGNSGIAIYDLHRIRALANNI
jgi:hypothetical protein